jgi:hypothetical protein
MSQYRKDLMIEIYTIVDFLYNNSKNKNVGIGDCRSVFIEKTGYTTYSVNIDGYRFHCSLDLGTWGHDKKSDNDFILSELVSIKRNFLIDKLNE